MSHKLERSRDEELEEERKSENKTKNLFKSVKNNDKAENNQYINVKNNLKEKDNLDSESDEYYEEEDEESGEIEDEDEEEINSEFKREKKKKLELSIGKWSRKKSDLMEVENLESLSSADIVINNPENKSDKKNIDINKEKTNDNKTQKKANFFTTPVDIGKNNPNNGEQKTTSTYFNVNSDVIDNKSVKSLTTSNTSLLNNSKLDVNLNKNENPNIIANNSNINNNENTHLAFPGQVFLTAKGLERGDRLRLVAFGRGAVFRQSSQFEERG